MMNMMMIMMMMMMLLMMMMMLSMMMMGGSGFVFSYTDMMMLEVLSINDVIFMSIFDLYREADSVYALLVRKSSLLKDNDNDQSSITTKTSTTTTTTTSSLSSHNNDILTDKERILFNDEYDNIIVSKRDPESANPVRVGTMDYFVPEKLPQPENYLESLVWDREKDIDRMRERFQLARALSQAKVAEAKYPRRSLINLINSKVSYDEEEAHDDEL